MDACRGTYLERSRSLLRARDVHPLGKGPSFFSLSLILFLYADKVNGTNKEKPRSMRFSCLLPLTSRIK